MLSFPASRGEDTDYTTIISADGAAVVSNMLVVDEMVVVGSAVAILVEAVMGTVVMGSAVVVEEAGKTLASLSVENLAKVAGIDMIVDVGEDDSPTEGLAETLIVIEGEDMVAVGSAEMLIGGAGKVVGTTA